MLSGGGELGILEAVLASTFAARTCILTFLNPDLQSSRKKDKTGPVPVHLRKGDSNEDSPPSSFIPGSCVVSVAQGSPVLLGTCRLYKHVLQTPQLAG